MVEGDNIEYVIYAKVNGQASQRFITKTKEELLDVIENDLQDEIDEELLFQEVRKENYEKRILRTSE